MAGNTTSILIRMLLISSSFYSGLSHSALAENVKYTLTNGDSISGKLLEKESNDQEIVIVSSLLGKLNIKRTSILQEPNENIWKGDFQVGLNSSNSSKNSSNGYSLDGSAEYQDKLNKITINADLLLNFLI